MSFISIIDNISTPWSNESSFEIDIGLPFTYYHEFLDGQANLHHSWSLDFLIIDLLLCTLLISLYILVKHKLNQKLKAHKSN